MYSYGVLVTIGFLLAVALGKREIQQHGVSWPSVAKGVVWCASAGLVGAKLIYLLNEWSAGRPVLTPQQIFGDGLVFYGAVLFALISAAAYCRVRALPTLFVLDTTALCFTLAHAIGRIGCFMAGCCHGRPTSEEWGVYFRSPFVALEYRVRPCIPVQLYESACLFLLFLVLFRMRRLQTKPGLILATYAASYSIIRFILEYFRGDSERGIYFGLSTSQWISFVFFIGSLMLLRRILGRSASLID